MWTPLACVALLTAAVAVAQPSLIANPSFEQDGTAIKGVGYVRDGNAISSWLMTGDGEGARNVQGGPFADNGLVPDGKVVAILQNRSLLRQEIGPLEPERVYRLTLRANGRAIDKAAYGHFGKLQVRLNGTVLVAPVEAKAVDGSGVHQQPFAPFEATFTTGGGKCLLELAQVDPADGISVLVDDLRLAAVDVPAEKAIRVNRARVRGATEPPPGVEFSRTQWIWSPEATSPLQAVPAGYRHFRRSFDVPDPAKVAQALIIASADNRGECAVNGTWMGSADSFSQWVEMDFTRALRAGRNVVTIEGFNAGDMPNPAGVAAMVLLYDAAGKPLQAIPTDASWRCSPTAPDGWQASDFDDGRWPAAMVAGPVGTPPWGSFGFLTWIVPDDFPRFVVPGQERHMELLRQLFWLHHSGSGPKATLWDGWMAMSSLWPATGPAPGASSFRPEWRSVLLSRRLDHEGYVSTHQHHGFGHGEGWPFPTHFQTGGVGWQFATAHNAYRVGPTRKVDNWGLQGIEMAGLNETEGWSLRLTADDASVTTPAFSTDSFIAPFIRLEWAPSFPDAATATLQWTTADAPEFDTERCLPLRLTADCPGSSFTHVALYRHPGWKGKLTRLRLNFAKAQGGSCRLLGLIGAPDTRHPVNNPCFLQGCTDYFNFTGDVSFLRENLARMRQALAFAINEFGVAKDGVVTVPWVGHSGRPGWTLDANGQKLIRAGEGIGANYWDLLPFSGRDCLATVYLLDALKRMATLEAAIAAHPEWQLPGPTDFSADQLSKLADFVAQQGRKEFWNPQTQRFAACRDADGVLHDYGYTFVNCEAVYFGLADAAQARAIVDWLDGKRTVAGDTSTGDDIYHFRFGPRATTRRNVDWYSFVWSGPESIPWGGQVQDGGAVLGFAFHDQMTRLFTAGPDSAWRKLRETLDWFADIRAAGGYRAYYAVPGRGTLQGGGPPGGLGMDCEFFESALVPQIMLYGFLGFEARPDGFALNPRLPSDWPSLRVTRVQFRDAVLDINATKSGLEITNSGQTMKTRLTLPQGWRLAGQPVAHGLVTLAPGQTVRAKRGQ